MLLKTLFISLLLLFSLSIFSQECFEYYKTACIPKESKFSYAENNSSVSFLFSSGETRELPFTLVSGIDYRITLCANAEFENIIQFVIRSTQGKEIYNNSRQNFNLNLEFSCRKTQEVIIELMAPQLNISNDNTVNIEGCIGLLIEEMVSVKTGF